MGQVAQYSKDLARLSDIAQLIRGGGIPTFMAATEGGAPAEGVAKGDVACRLIPKDQADRGKMRTAGSMEWEKKRNFGREEKGREGGREWIIRCQPGSCL